MKLSTMESSSQIGLPDWIGAGRAGSRRCQGTYTGDRQQDQEGAAGQGAWGNDHPTPRRSRGSGRDDEEEVAVDVLTDGRRSTSRRQLRSPLLGWPRAARMTGRKLGEDRADVGRSLVRGL